MIGRRALVAIAIACGAGAGTAQVRDSARVTATGSLSGTVLVAGAGKQPARRVRVTLTDVSRAIPGQTTTTDDSGAFLFHGVPAGRFELQAFKNGYLRASYGASRPDRAGTPIVVKEGDKVADLTMTIARGGVITGVVRDIRGRPLPGVSVRVPRLGYDAVTGEPSLSTPATSFVAPTDDRGEYRAYGLPPGGYLVLVTPSPATGRSGRGEEIRQLTTQEIQQALQAARAGGGTPSPVSRPVAAPAGPRVTYAPVFHPGVTDIAAAATIVLGVSEERTGVDVNVQLVQTATVSGTVSSATGALPRAVSIGLVPSGPRAGLLSGAGLRGPSTQSNANGAFVISGVPPGTYTLKTFIGRGRGDAGDVAAMSAIAEVVVSGQDIDVPLTLQPGVPISGRVVFEGTRPSAAELQTLSYSLVPLGSSVAGLSSGGGRVDADGRFTFAGVVPDAYRFVEAWTASGARDKWTITSAVANGRDAFESPLRVNPNEPIEWTITYTDAPATLAGVLQDRSGRAGTDYYVLVFSSDRRYWSPGSRRVGMTRPATDGAFRIKGLPAGEYFVAALADLEPGEWNDPSLLDQLARSAIKVVLRVGETTTSVISMGGA